MFHSIEVSKVALVNHLLTRIEAQIQSAVGSGGAPKSAKVLFPCIVDQVAVMPLAAGNMAPLKIYGMGLSTCTRRVMTTCIEKNVEYELVVVDLTKGEHKSPEYMAKQVSALLQATAGLMPLAQLRSLPAIVASCARRL